MLVIHFDPFRELRLFYGLVCIECCFSNQAFIPYISWFQAVSEECIKTRNTFGCESNKVYEKSLLFSQEQNFDLSK